MFFLPQLPLALTSGSLVGFSLGLVGGGGSILAVPLMVYAVGVPTAHVAIGTSALAVAANAAANLVTHARAGTVRWQCAGVFATAGVLGAWLGSNLGKVIDGQRLLFLFAILMMVVGATMLLPRTTSGDAEVNLDRGNFPRLVVLGVFAGALSGFFGIGGGFLIVPGLMLATGMPILNAVGSSLLGVAAFGAATALNYAISGLVDWSLAILFIGGGIVGGLAGVHTARVLARQRRTLNVLFACVIFVVAAYMLVGPSRVT
jgi:uncharacterized membrane protein YfcA